MVAAAFGGRDHVVIHYVITYCFFGLGPAMFSALAPIVFSALAPPCFFGFWPLLYFQPLVLSASLYNVVQAVRLK